MGFRKASDAVEQRSPHEDALVAIWQSSPSHSHAITSFDQPIEETVGFDPLAEGTARNRLVGQGHFDLLNTARIERIVGMQKQEDVSRGPVRTGILLNCPPRRSAEDERARLTGELARFVVAAAIDDNHFVRSRPQCGVDRPGDVVLFVECWDDDRDVHACNNPFRCSRVPPPRIAASPVCSIWAARSSGKLLRTHEFPDCLARPAEWIEWQRIPLL